MKIDVTDKQLTALETALQLAINKPTGRVFRVDGSLTQLGDEAYANLLDILHQVNKLGGGCGKIDIEALDMWASAVFLRNSEMVTYDRKSTVEENAFDNHYEFIAHHRRRNKFYCKGKFKDYSHLVKK